MKAGMRSAVVVALAWALAGGAAGAGEAAAVVGTWRLLTFERHAASGEVAEPFGPSPRGVLTYTARGHVSVHLMQPDRPAFAGRSFRDGTDAEVRTAFEGYFGYFGRYSVEAKTDADGAVVGSVTHHVEGCAFPNYVGTDRTRALELKGDRLTLTTPRSDDGPTADWYRVVWERAR